MPAIIDMKGSIFSVTPEEIIDDPELYAVLIGIYGVSFQGENCGHFQRIVSPEVGIVPDNGKIITLLFKKDMIDPETTMSHAIRTNQTANVNTLISLAQDKTSVLSAYLSAVVRYDDIGLFDQLIEKGAKIDENVTTAEFMFDAYDIIRKHWHSFQPFVSDVFFDVFVSLMS